MSVKYGPCQVNRPSQRSEWFVQGDYVFCIFECLNENSLSLNVLFMQSPIEMQQDIMQYSDSALICCQLLEIILA